MERRGKDFHEIRRRFAEMVGRPEEKIALAEGALLLAAEEYPDLDIGSYLERIRAIADVVRDRVGLELNPLKWIHGINSYLFDEEGFHGDTEDYYDPKNSFLNEVLDRKTGIPITLSTLYMEIAWHLDLPVVGVGLPGHFIVKYQAADREILINPFHRGVILTEEDCQKSLDRIYHGQILFHRGLLAPTPKREILARMLNNLKGIYLRRQDSPRALGVVERLLLIHPDSPTEIRDRGLIYGELKRLPEAIADLRHYLERAPAGEDREAITEHLRHLQIRLASQN